MKYSIRSGFGDDAISQARLLAYNNMRGHDINNNYVAAASNITDAAIQANQALATFEEVTVEFPNTSIGRQLQQVARVIKKTSRPECRAPDFLYGTRRFRHPQWTAD